MKQELKFALTALAVLTVCGSAQAKDWPNGYSKCADEGGQCRIGSSPASVSFGAKGRWVEKTLSGVVICNAETFGTDPNESDTKKCAVGPRAKAPPPAPPSGGTGSTQPPSPPTNGDPHSPPSPDGDVAREAAPTSGWAGYAGGTTGGQAATAQNVYLVNSAPQLIASLQGTQPKIVKIQGLIDMAAMDNGGPFMGPQDQSKRNRITVPSNTTIIGVGADAQLLNAAILISNVENVIVRNLKIANPCDIAPKWDPNDGPEGNWNSEYDGIVIENSKHVWIDHNHFTDAPITDDRMPIENNKRVECHDGALDVKKGSDYVTASYNVFELHEKNNLIGSSDSAKDDEGHLTMTFNGNLFSDVAERAPRVRFGKVHLYNNYHQASKFHPVYPHQYSVGVGYKARIISTANVFDIAGAKSCEDVVKNPGSKSRPGAIIDTASLLNGAALDLANQCHISADVGWAVPYSYSAVPAGEVKQLVTSRAGVGKLLVR